METNICLIYTKYIPLHQINIKVNKKEIEQMHLFNADVVVTEYKKILLQLYSSAACLSVEPVEIAKTILQLVKDEEANVYPLPFKY